MRILLCHNFYRFFGGEGASVLDLKKILEKNGHEVYLYAKYNVNISKCNIVKKFFLLLNAIFSLRTYHEVTRVVQHFKPDIVHVHNIFPLISPSIYLSVKRKRIPIVQTAHNFRLLCPNGYFYIKGKICEKCKNGNYFHAVLNKCYRNSYGLSLLYGLVIYLYRRTGIFTSKIDMLICPSDFMKDKMTNNLFPVKKTAVIPYLLDQNSEKERKQNHFLKHNDFGFSDDNQRYIVYMGRLTTEKGLMTLIRAFDGLKECRLKILGEGPLKEELVLKIRKHNIEGIDLLGFIRHEKRFAILKKAIGTIVPSEWYENLPMTVLESFKFGVPVIASEIGALAQLVKNGKNGLLFEMGNSQDLKDKILYLIHNPLLKKRMGEYAYRHYQEKYSANENYKKLMTTYNELISRDI